MKLFLKNVKEKCKFSRSGHVMIMTVRDWMRNG